jgi:23S rRNA pseudouridine1911/1915/1917 synthase
VSSSQQPPVDEAEAGLRLEQLLRRRLPALSRGAVLRLIARGLVRVDGRLEPKGTRVRAGQRLEVELASADEQPIAQPELPLEVLRVTGDWIALCKPAGMPTHPLFPGETGTLANALVARFPECAAASPAAREAGLAHRLDTSTSGVILAARSQQAYDELRRQFSSEAIRKRYLALVAGSLLGTGSIDCPLRAAPGDRRRVQAAAEGSSAAQPARSDFWALQQRAGFSLVSVETHTGRRHQVRVHLAHLGHPLAGDLLYGGPAVEGLRGAFLHAAELRFLADGAELCAPLPADRRALLQRLGFDPTGLS